MAINKSMTEKNLSLVTGAIEQVNNVRRDVSGVKERYHLPLKARLSKMFRVR